MLVMTAADLIGADLIGATAGPLVPPTPEPTG
jgi:hypothetical protein